LPESDDGTELSIEIGGSTGVWCHGGGIGVDGSAVFGLCVAIGLGWGVPRCLFTYLENASAVLLVAVDLKSLEEEF